jgi:hypothetical protein
LAGVGIMFEDAATVLHISDFLGLENRQGL